ncbi:MAG: hypothetical protein ACI814_001202, partial [Mariniblastus sp.]
PQIRTETYWVNVPESRQRVVMKRVPFKIARQHVLTYTVNIPYQVRISVPQRFCRMVPKQITIPVEPVCDECSQNFPQLHGVSRSYLQYGTNQAGQAWDRLINP